ncbi:hypothetical protein [Actinoplanes sp. TFC3]|nr:hypothetical protein [Actinoplanes sp. TFC3]
MKHGLHVYDTGGDAIPITAPMLLHGEQDMVVPASHSAWPARRIPALSCG